jgi:integrase
MQRGTITRVPNGWKARYRLGGRSSSERSRTFQRKSDAQAWLADSIAKLNTGLVIDPNAGRVPFKDAADSWMASRLHIRESTRLSDRSLLDKHVLPTFADLPISAISPSRVRGWVQALQAKGLAPNTVRAIHRLLSAILGAAVADGVLPRNVAQGTKLPKAPKSTMRAIPLDRVLALADAISERYRAMVVVAGTAGLRLGETVGLTVAQLHLLERPPRLRVTQQLARVGGRWVVSPPKTAASVRSVTLPRFTVDVLAAHMAKFPPHPDGYIFTTPTGTPVDASNFRTRVWRPLVKAHGLVGFRFHDLRHSHAGHLIEQGQHPKVIQERMGHGSIQVTLDTYGHLMPGMDDRVVGALDDALDSARQKPSEGDIGYVG